MPFETQSGTAQIKLPGGKTVQVTVGPTTKGPQRPRLGRLDICNEDQQRRITSAFGYAAMLVQIVRDMGGACIDLADKMERLGTNDLWITCDLCALNEEASSFAADSPRRLGSISICSFPDNWNLTRIIMREQVRLAGGMPIDMWAVDSYVFFTPNHYLDPRAKPAMCTGSRPYSYLGSMTKSRQGTYVIWDPPTGNLFTQNRPGTNTSSTTVVSASNFWKHTC